MGVGEGRVEGDGCLTRFDRGQIFDPGYNILGCGWACGVLGLKREWAWDVDWIGFLFWVISIKDPVWF